MIYNRKFSILLILLFLTSCAEYKLKSKTNNTREYYSSKGFALIYEDDLYLNKTINKRITKDNFIALHSSLKRNTFVNAL